jgi:cytochrome c-type biogenesis protein CcmH
MVALWALVAVIGGAVLAVLLVPLRIPTVAPRRADYDLRIYRDQLGEVKRDCERGLLSDDQAEAATVEIQRRILSAADEADASDPSASHPLSARVVVAAAVTAPLAAVAFYMSLGQPSQPDLPFADRPQARQMAQNAPGPHAGGTAQGMQSGQMDQMVGRLAERLLKNPDDVEGWILLGRSYVNLNRFDDAVNAFRRAYEASGKHPGVAADLGEVLITRAEGLINAEAQQLFTDALAADPRTVKARYYLGAAKAQAGDMEGALAAWVDLVAVSPPTVPWLPAVREQIGVASKQLGFDPATLEPSAAAAALGPPTGEPASEPASAAAPAAGPSRDDVKAAQEMSPEDRAQMIRGMVERLADRLKDNPNDRQGWLRLGRAYQVLGDEEKARDALARAEALGGGQVAPSTPAPSSVAPGPSREDVKAAQQMSPEDRTQMIRGMVQRLADKLAENPDDRDGWLRLGRAYQVLGETGKADDAFAKAKALAE